MHLHRDLVRHIHHHLLFIHHCHPDNVKELKYHREIIDKLLKELRPHLHAYGASEEFFRNQDSATSPIRLLIKCLEDFNSESQTLASEIVTTLVSVKFLLSPYWHTEASLQTENMEVVDFLLSTMFDLVESDSNVALLFRTMLRESIRESKAAAKHVLDSHNCINKFVTCLTSPNHASAALVDVADTFETLLTTHESCVAEFLWENCKSFFEEFNSKLLASNNPLIKSKALTVLGNVLKNHPMVTAHYLKDADNLMLVMEALIFSENKSVELEAFEVFKLFVLNSEKPFRIIETLRLNRLVLLRTLDKLKPFCAQQGYIFNYEKARVVRVIVLLDPQSHTYQIALGKQLCRNAFKSHPAPKTF